MALTDKLKAIANGFRSSRGISDKLTLTRMATLAAEKTGGFPNGTAWTRISYNGYFNAVHNANGIWVAGSGGDTGLYYSVDGKEWTQSNITSGYFNAVHNANGIWVAGSSGGLYYSVAWELQS